MLGIDEPNRTYDYSASDDFFNKMLQHVGPDKRIKMPFFEYYDAELFFIFSAVSEWGIYSMDEILLKQCINVFGNCYDAKILFNKLRLLEITTHRDTYFYVSQIGTEEHRRYIFKEPGSFIIRTSRSYPKSLVFNVKVDTNLRQLFAEKFHFHDDGEPYYDILATYENGLYRIFNELHELEQIPIIYYQFFKYPSTRYFLRGGPYRLKCVTNRLQLSCHLDTRNLQN